MSEWVEVPPKDLRELRERAAFQQNLPRPDPKLVAREYGGLRVHFWGELGEWSVAHALGLKLHDLYDKGGDGHLDFRIPDGRRVDAKATPHVGGVLLFPRRANFVSDLAVLVYTRKVEERVFTLTRGWITRAEFLANCAPFKHGRLGTEVCMQPNELWPMESLVAACASHAHATRI